MKNVSLEAVLWLRNLELRQEETKLTENEFEDICSAIRKAAKDFSNNYDRFEEVVIESSTSEVQEILVQELYVKDDTLKAIDASKLTVNDKQKAKEAILAFWEKQNFFFSAAECEKELFAGEPGQYINFPKNSDGFVQTLKKILETKPTDWQIRNAEKAERYLCYMQHYKIAENLYKQLEQETINISHINLMQEFYGIMKDKLDEVNIKLAEANEARSKGEEEIKFEEEMENIIIELQEKSRRGDVKAKSFLYIDHLVVEKIMRWEEAEKLCNYLIEHFIHNIDLEKTFIGQLDIIFKTYYFCYPARPLQSALENLFFVHPDFRNLDLLNNLDWEKCRELESAKKLQANIGLYLTIRQCKIQNELYEKCKSISQTLPPIAKQKQESIEDYLKKHKEKKQILEQNPMANSSLNYGIIEEVKKRVVL